MISGNGGSRPAARIPMMAKIAKQSQAVPNGSIDGQWGAVVPAAPADSRNLQNKPKVAK
jgi:hypothetical protein